MKHTLSSFLSCDAATSDTGIWDQEWFYRKARQVGIHDDFIFPFPPSCVCSGVRRVFAWPPGRWLVLAHSHQLKERDDKGRLDL